MISPPLRSLPSEEVTVKDSEVPNRHWLFQSLLEPLPAARVTNQREIDQKYTHWRWRQMYASFFAYVVYYFLRKNWSVALPALGKDLGFDNKTLGAINSAHYAAYSIGKFVNGVLADRANVRYFMAMGLFLSALCNLFFGLSSGFWSLAIWWGLNGWVQSMGWPPAAKILTHWYGHKERGTWWGAWSVSHSVGAAGILMVGGVLAQHYGWRSTFIFPAALGFFSTILIIERLRDTPKSLGLPSIEDYKNDHPAIEKLTDGESFKTILFKRVLTNPYVWLMAAINFCVYTCRYGALDWAPKFLVEQKGSSLASAGYKTSLLEIAGVLAAIVAGRVSDRFFPGRRVLINVFFLMFFAVAIYGFWVIPAEQTILQAGALFLIGFSVYGPQMLVGGPCTVDFVSKKAAAAATGFVGMTGYFGAMLSGSGFGWVLDHYGWKGGFVSLSVSAVLAILLCFLAFLLPKTQGSETKA